MSRATSARKADWYKNSGIGLYSTKNLKKNILKKEVIIMATTKNVYTYNNMIDDVLYIVDNLVDEITDDLGLDTGAITSKLLDFKASLDKKAEYSATHKTNKPKGASAETLEKAEQIKSVLTSEPMTSTEINTALRSDFSALQIANAIKYIDGVKASKVVRQTRNTKGLLCEKEYTAYSI